MRQALLPQSLLADFVAFLASDRKLIGPVSLGHGQFQFGEVRSLEEMSLQHLPTILPPKKYFMPQHETLLEFDLRQGQRMQAVVELERLVLFGVHSCDLAGLQCLNLVFTDRPKDLHYLVRKNHILLIGLECLDYCDRHANCAMFGNHLPKGGYDLFFSELDDGYFVHVNTREGEALVNGSGLFEDISDRAQRQLEQLRRQKAARFRPEVAIAEQELPPLFEATYDSPQWEELGKRCLACGNCTNVCPTCYCFDVMDETDLGQTRGRRIRVWDSCQHEGFAKVAGGESFRKTRRERQRHRFHRKFNYPMLRYGRLFCTGCGRCSRSCMAGIDLKETLRALISEGS